MTTGKVQSQAVNTVLCHLQPPM